MEIICGRTPNCGFRVHSRYYIEKQRFSPGICARCNGPIKIVEDHSDVAVGGVYMSTDPKESPGAILQAAS